MSKAKGVRVFGHPLHAMLSDLPVALLGTSLLWDGIGLWRGEPVWLAISFWNVALGLAVALVTAAVGMIDYAALKEGHPALATGMRHMLWMLAALGAYSASLLVRRGPAPPSGVGILTAVLILEAFGLVLISFGGWYGGHLVFRHGIGRDDAQSEGGSQGAAGH